MSDHALFYKHSGRFNPAAVAWSFAAMIGAGLGMGFAYGVLVWLVPFIYLVFIGTIGLGFGVGALANLLTIKAHTRNNMLSVLGVSLAAVAALYAAWVGYLFAASEWDFLAWNPLDIVSAAEQIAETGLWSISGTTPTGAMLYGVWLIEAGIIVGVGVVMAVGSINGLPYNEKAGAWCDASETLPPAKALAPEAIRQIRQQLKAGDLSCFGLFEPLDDEDAALFIAFRINWAPGYEDEQFLTITAITLTQDEKGNIQAKKNAIANNMVIDAEARAVIDEILAPDPAVEAGDETVGANLDSDSSAPE